MNNAATKLFEETLQTWVTEDALLDVVERHYGVKKREEWREILYHWIDRGIVVVRQETTLFDRSILCYRLRPAEMEPFDLSLYLDLL